MSRAVNHIIYIRNAISEIRQWTIEGETDGEIGFSKVLSPQPACDRRKQIKTNYFNITEVKVSSLTIGVALSSD